jgi:hypothetical protein
VIRAPGRHVTRHTMAGAIGTSALILATVALITIVVHLG